MSIEYIWDKLEQQGRFQHQTSVPDLTDTLVSLNI